MIGTTVLADLSCTQFCASASYFATHPNLTSFFTTLIKVISVFIHSFCFLGLLSVSCPAALWMWMGMELCYPCLMHFICGCDELKIPKTVTPPNTYKSLQMEAVPIQSRIFSLVVNTREVTFTNMVNHPPWQKLLKSSSADYLRGMCCCFLKKG